MTGYEAAKAKYEALGVDTDRAIERLKKVPVSLHCWQLDDVIGFDNDGGLTGGIQTTGNYPGRARTPQQLMEDMEEAMKLMPGTAKLNIHASYAIFEPGEFADRDALEPKHFAKWVEFAKKRNPFNHPCVMFRKSAVMEAGGYNGKFRMEDYYLWIRMLQTEYESRNLKDVLLYMRTPADMYIRRGGWLYAKDMVRFHWWSYKNGGEKLGDFVTGAIPHAIVCVLPNYLRKTVYEILHR